MTERAACRKVLGTDVTGGLMSHLSIVLLCCMYRSPTAMIYVSLYLM